ncbi:hypothetical protein FQZ97_945610 [compost metagenome]
MDTIGFRADTNCGAVNRGSFRTGTEGSALPRECLCSRTKCRCVVMSGHGVVAESTGVIAFVVVITDRAVSRSTVCAGGSVTCHRPFANCSGLLRKGLRASAKGSGVLSNCLSAFTQCDRGTRIRFGISAQCHAVQATCLGIDTQRCTVFR